MGDFIRPDLPARFVLVDPAVAAEEVQRHCDGPFDAAAAHYEPDNAIVWVQDGCLPFRLGVRAQTGDLLTLHDGSQLRVVARPRPTNPQYLPIDLPEQFVLETRAFDGRWVRLGAGRRDRFIRESDGSYVCSDGGSPLFLRCVARHGDGIECVDGLGDRHIYRLRPLAP